MATTVTYTCDRCKTESSTNQQMWKVGVSLKSMTGNVFASQSEQDWCRKCCEHFHILTPADKRVTEHILETKPTLEDMVREIAAEAALDAMSAA